MCCITFLDQSPDAARMLCEKAVAGLTAGVDLNYIVSFLFRSQAIAEKEHARDYSVCWGTEPRQQRSSMMAEILHHGLRKTRKRRFPFLANQAAQTMGIFQADPDACSTCFADTGSTGPTVSSFTGLIS